MKIFSLICYILLFSLALSGQGLIFDQTAFDEGLQYERLRADYVPKSYSLKSFTPFVLQQQRATCVAYSSVYALAIIQAKINNIKSNEEISLIIGSPHWIYYRNKDVSDITCMSGLNIEKTMMDILNNGVPYMLLVEFPDYYPFSEIHLCNYYPPDYSDHARYALLNKPDEIYRIREAGDVKSALSNGMPVVFGMNVPPSFEKSIGKSLWTPEASENGLTGYGHAMVVVAYDDFKFGGAYEIINSWGEKWGNEGFIWIRYSDFENYFLGGYAFYKESKLGSALPEYIESDGNPKIELDMKLSRELKKKTRLSKRWTRLGKR